MDFMQIGTDF